MELISLRFTDMPRDQIFHDWYQQMPLRNSAAASPPPFLLREQDQQQEAHQLECRAPPTAPSHGVYGSRMEAQYQLQLLTRRPLAADMLACSCLGLPTLLREQVMVKHWLEKFQ